MPLPRILAVGTAAMVFLLGSLWAMNVNYLAWVGAWLTPDVPYSAGALVVLTLGLAGAWVYAAWPGAKLPGPGAVRGVLYGALLGAFAIWALPGALEWVAGVLGNVQVVFQGEEVAAQTARETIGRSAVLPCPEIAGIKPPLAFLTRDTAWAPADAWAGRILPLGLGFMLYGLVLGVFLSEDPAKNYA